MESSIEELRRRASEKGGAAIVSAIDELVANCDAIDFEPTKDELEIYLQLARQGRYAAFSLARHPDDLRSIANSRSVSLPLDAHLQQLRREVAAVDTEDDLKVALRRHKRRHTLRVFLREVEGVASVRQTAAEIATIAEAALVVAVEKGAQILGDESLADDISILGMGKLGGRELNFSSDVDLIIISRDTTATDDERKSRVDQLARLVVRAMEETTADGYVFRVDLRLRPEGSQGPLVPSRSAFVAYYLSWGRTWERSAMIKARPVAGNLELGEEALAELDPFVYRKYLDFQAIDELRSMKEKIHENARISAVVGLSDEPVVEAEAETKRSGFGASSRGTSSRRARLRRHRKSQRSRSASPPDPEAKSHEAKSHEAKNHEENENRPDPRGVRGWDVKIGVGGIREIEFFVQALQLVHCGTRPGLRVKNTLDALDRLLYAGLLSHDDHARLADAYDFFRRLEHRIQMEDDRQTHRLPTRSDQLDALADRLGYERSDLLTGQIDVHRDATRELFDRLFRDAERDSTAPTVPQEGLTALQTVTGAPADALHDPAVLSALAELGFERPRQVAGQIQILRDKSYGPFAANAFAERTGAGLGRYLLEVAAAAPDSDQAFSYLTRFITTVGNRPGYYRMLAENPHATRLLAHVFGSSGYLANPLIQDPNVFERLLGVGTFAVMRSSDDFEADLKQRLERVEDPAHRMGLIRRFHQEETLRIGIHETGGAARVVQTTQQLSVLAEVVIRAVLAEVYEPLRTRRRRPGSVLPELAEIPFSVVAMGKLGGRELGFGSDLDIVFIYEDERQWRLEHTFFARFAQRLVRSLSSASAQGKLYEVDTRLRPSGNQGALVVSADAFDAYHREDAALWEKQALLRARPIAGPEGLVERIASIRHEHAVALELDPSRRAEISGMRDKILENLRPESGEDVKFSPGGLIDVEFLVQAVQLERPGQPSASAGIEVGRGVHSQNTTTALGALADAGFDGFDASQLSEDYQWLRRVEARLRMSDQRASSELPGEPREREMLARRLGFQGAEAGAQFMSELAQVFDRVLAVRDGYFSG